MASEMRGMAMNTPISPNSAATTSRPMATTAGCMSTVRAMISGSSRLPSIWLTTT